MSNEDEDEQFDPLPGIIASIDQSVQIVPHLARWAMALYESFTGAGFSEAQALELTANQIKGIL